MCKPGKCLNVIRFTDKEFNPVTNKAVASALSVDPICFSIRLFFLF